MHHVQERFNDQISEVSHIGRRSIHMATNALFLNDMPSGLI